jgi:hypothetical protein
MIPGVPLPELEIFLEASGKIALDNFSASAADTAERNELEGVINCYP